MFSYLRGKRKKNNIMVLDDGFQDNTVKKKLNILCFNSIDMVGNGFLIPSGPLREPLRNMINSQIVVINGKRNIVFEKKLRSISKQTKIFYSKYIFNKKNIRKENVLAFAGIGNPEGFFNLLKENNFNFKEKFSYPDHYNFQKNEIKELIKKEKKENLKLLTTEKDYFRIKKLGFKGIYYMPVTLKILKTKLFEKNTQNYEKIHNLFFQSFIIYLLFILSKIIGLKLSRLFFLFLLKSVTCLNQKIILENLEKINPNFSEVEKERMVKECGLIMENFYRIHIFKNFKKSNHIKIKNKVLRDMKKINKLFFISGHFANFELMSMELTKSNIKLATIYRPLNNIFLNPFMDF